MTSLRYLADIILAAEGLYLLLAGPFLIQGRLGAASSQALGVLFLASVIYVIAAYQRALAPA